MRSLCGPSRLATGLLTVALLTCLTVSGKEVGRAAIPDFARDITPIFVESCGQCHLNSSMGKLRLDSPAAVLRGGASGPAVVPGRSGESLLVKRLLGMDDAPRMPMGAKPLPQAKVDLIRNWIDHGDFTATPTQAASPVVPAVAQPSGNSSDSFAKKVRPILASRCYSCHGPDAQQSGLRLDSLAAILKGSDNGPVVAPGSSDHSRLVRRLLAKDRPQMPYGGPPLSETEIAAIRQWIDSGAAGPDDNTPLVAGKAPRHWAYVKPVQPPVPAVKEASWVKNPIDNFILARLEKDGLKPSKEASRTTLLRRVYLDLAGLPPSPAEIEAFQKDERPDAYERVVDHLLASPHYGEHWARQWLDLARYADSNGYEKDGSRTAWEYRDWVIRALNADLSFREFTTDQIAGDMLPHPTKDQLIATGFNRNSMLNQEGGIDLDEYYYYTQVDRANTTASVWLGATLACAQCHNHKFDPYTHKDYYRFLAFFSNSEHHPNESDDDHWMIEPELELPTAEQAAASAKLRAEAALLQRKLETQTPELDAGEKTWMEALRAAEQKWTVLKPARTASKGGTRFATQADGSILAQGDNPQADTYTIEAISPLKKITGVRLEVLPDPSLPHGGPGRDPGGNFFLTDFNVSVSSGGGSGDGQPVVWKSAAADESQRGYDLKSVVHKKKGQLGGWVIEEQPADAQNKLYARQAVFVPEQAIAATTGSLTITLRHNTRHASKNIGRFRLSVTEDSDPAFIVQIPAKLRPLLQRPMETVSVPERDDLARAYRTVAPLLDTTRAQLQDIQKRIDGLGIATAMIMGEKPGFARPAAYIRERGTFTSPGELVYADVPAALNPLPKDAMPNRLGLAEWLTSEDNPLTARVAVNHFWETIFGHGIVETSEDFGSQGDPPSHPELLDWLATRFMQDGWSMKKIQRLMVTSATYRQDSGVTPEGLSKDPYNRLYARGPRFRFDAETVHDSTLAAAGLLSAKMYGPPVFPYQPEGVWDVPYSSEKWIESSGEDKYRRAVYTMLRRSAPYPSLVTFDAPSRETCTVRRVRTNTPLQALTKLNDPFFFDAARALAARLLTEAGQTSQDRIRYGFLLTVGRPPSESEQAKVEEFYKRELVEYRQEKAAALATIAAKPGAAPDASEKAAWTMVANVLLNSDEAITKE